MRKFTKHHREITYLFPDLNNSSEEASEKNYDFYESMAMELFDIAHKNEKEFTKDDLIDSFMKGASVAHRKLICDVLNRELHLKFIEENLLNNQEEQINLLQNIINKLK